MRRLPVLLLLVLATACGGGSAGDGTGGIQGTVTIGPQCPVEQAGSPCPDAPFAGLVTVTSGGEVVQEVRSATDGTYRVSLEPGAYTVVAGSADGMGIAVGTPVEAVVGEGSFVRVDLSVDSGIR
jgi:hypothetical protein